MAAREWVRIACHERDFVGSLRITDPMLSLAGAQDWLWRNGSHPNVVRFDRDEAARALADGDEKHPLWRPFVDTQFQRMDQVWSDGLNFDEYGVGSRPRPIAPDYELVVFIHNEGKVIRFDKPTPVLAHQFLMHRTDAGWLVAGFSDRIPTPGWPPQL
jgi:hypothetical protein